MLKSPTIFCVLVLICTSCSFNLDVNKPVEMIWDKTGKKVDSVIIFLPGLLDTAKIFEEEQFFSTARKAGITADMVAASINIRHLIEGMMIERIEKDIFRYLNNEGYKNIWLVGMSLGALNSLLFYQKYAKNICGVVMLAPFIADEDLTKELQQAGRIDKWVPKPTENKKVLKQKLQYLWQWLQQQESQNNLNQLYLGYGKEDKYKDSITLLQNILDKKNVIVVEGNHDWVTGRKIWQQQLSLRSKTGLLQPCN